MSEFVVLDFAFPIPSEWSANRKPETQFSIGQANAAPKVFKARVRAEGIEARP
jgi:hypothetical protein